MAIALVIMNFFCSYMTDTRFDMCVTPTIAASTHAHQTKNREKIWDTTQNVLKMTCNMTCHFWKRQNAFSSRCFSKLRGNTHQWINECSIMHKNIITLYLSLSMYIASSCYDHDLTFVCVFVSVSLLLETKDRSSSFLKETRHTRDDTQMTHKSHHHIQKQKSISFQVINFLSCLFVCLSKKGMENFIVKSIITVVPYVPHLLDVCVCLFGWHCDGKVKYIKINYLQVRIIDLVCMCRWCDLIMTDKIFGTRFTELQRPCRRSYFCRKGKCFRHCKKCWVLSQLKLFEIRCETLLGVANRVVTIRNAF